MPASSSSYPTTFFFSCNTAFHPLQLSSLLPNPLPPSSTSSSSATFLVSLLHPSSPTHHPLHLSSLPPHPLLFLFLHRSIVSPYSHGFLPHRPLPFYYRKNKTGLIFY